MEKSRIVAVLVVLALANWACGDRTYSCWGGCYNDCFIKAGSNQSQRLACGFQCLNSCIPRSAADFNYYCQIGCSLKRCIPVSFDGAKLEGCFGFCTNLCNTIITP